MIGHRGKKKHATAAGYAKVVRAQMYTQTGTIFFFAFCGARAELKLR